MTRPVSCGRRHPPLPGRRTPRPGPVRVCVCSLFLAESGGPASKARCGAPHLIFGNFCFCFAPSRPGVAPFLFLCLPLFFFCVVPFVRLRCFLLSMVSGRWSLGPWRFVFLSTPPPRLVFFLSRQLCAPVVSGFLWFPAPGALGLGAVWCLFCWSAASWLRVRVLLCFLPGRLLLPGCCCPPAPPPLLPFCISRFSSLLLGAPPLFFCLPRSCLLAERSSVVLAVCPPPASLVCFAGLPLLGSPCALAAFVFPARPLAAPWWFLPPPPLLCLVLFFAAARCSVFFIFLLCCIAPPACLVLVGSSCRLLPSPPSCCLFCWSPAAWLPMCSRCFSFSRLAAGCSPMVAAPPSLLLCHAAFVAAAQCSFFFPIPPSAALLPPACLALVGSSRRLLPPPTPPWCLRGALSVWCCRTALPFSRVFCGAVLPCSACLRCGLLSGFGLRCRVLCCAVCPWVRCCAALLRVVLPGVVLLCAVLFCCDCRVWLPVVPCPLALPVALGPPALRHCILR